MFKYLFLRRFIWDNGLSCASSMDDTHILIVNPQADNDIRVLL